MISNIEVIGLVISLIWSLILSVFFWQLYSHYNNLVKGVSSKNLKTVLENLLKEVETSKKDIDFLISRCDRIEKEGTSHIQKIGLLRFNPFKDTGGDQSFIVSLVDAENNGVVISGLYSRSGTRWYAKKVSKGIGIEHELSDEEKKALKEAKSQI
ncbi:DUF4446 family protein [Candidatus Microgenomates bacterium]|nr:MAG: DUF4446 family protein [Candidatus Microgenomates bacterium]